MIRWNYVLPRLLLLAAVAVMVVLGSRPLVKWGLIQSGQALTGAKVEIAGIDVDWWNGRLQLSEVEVADPRDPMRNLLQCDLATIDLDPRQVWHRRVIVEQARVGGVQFGTPRTTPGTLHRQPDDGYPSPADWVQVLRHQIEPLADQWLEIITGRAQVIAQRDLLTLAVAAELEEKWPEKFREMRTRAHGMQQRAEELEMSLRTLSRNPLRDADRYRTLAEEMRRLQSDIEAARRQLHQWANELAADRQRLLQAKRTDRERLAQRVNQGDWLDRQLVSELLVGEWTANHIEETLNWIHWFRDTLPDPDRDFNPQRSRGFDVQFRRHPRLIFKQVHLEGSGRLAGQHFAFFGEANDISTNPKLYDRPTTIRLRGAAEAEVIVNAMLDRRGPQPMDSFQITCPQLHLPRRSLGAPGHLLVDVSPSQLVLELDVQLIDDRISGHVHLHSNDLELQVAELHPSLNRDELLEQLNLHLADIDRFSVEVDLYGSLEELRVNLNSDLGTAVARSIEASLRDQAQRWVVQRTEELDRLVDDQIQQMNRQFSQEVNEILVLLEREIPVVADLEKLIPSFGNWPTIR